MGEATIYLKTTKEFDAVALRKHGHSMQHFVAGCVTRKLAELVKIVGEKTVFFRNMNTLRELSESSL